MNKKLNQNTVQSADEENATIESTLKIAKLGLEYPVYSKASDELLKTSVCKLWGPEANEIGNYVIIGNNNDEIFGKLSTLSIGDTLEISSFLDDTQIYKVYDIYVTKTEDITVASQITDGKKEVTLITIVNNGIQRLVVKCEEI